MTVHFDSCVNHFRSQFTVPTVHFPAQQCPLCDLDRVFDTRNAFSHHLQNAHDSFWCADTGAIRPLHRREATALLGRSSSATKAPLGATAPAPAARRRQPGKAPPVPLMDLAVGPSQSRPLHGPHAAVATVRDHNPFPLDARTGRGAGRGEALACVLSSFPGQGMPLRPILAAKALPGIPSSTPATTAIPRPWVHLPPQLRPVTYAAATTPVVVCFSSPLTT